MLLFARYTLQASKTLHRVGIVGTHIDHTQIPGHLCNVRRRFQCSKGSLYSFSVPRVHYTVCVPRVHCTVSVFLRFTIQFVFLGFTIQFQCSEGSLYSFSVPRVHYTVCICETMFWSYPHGCSYVAHGTGQIFS